MALNSVLLQGDTGTLFVTMEAFDPVGDPPIPISGSFRGCPEERRVASLFLELPGTPTRTVEVRFEYLDARFAETTITGKRRPAAPPG